MIYSSWGLFIIYTLQLQGCITTAAEVLQMMNTKVDPCQDFYRYVYCSCLLLYITSPQLNHFLRNCDSDWKWCVYKITNKKNCKHLCRSSNFVVYRVPTLHMKRWWVSNINVWFPYICERFIYFQDRSAYSAAGKYVDQSWEYTNRSQTYQWWMWKFGLRQRNSQKRNT